MTLVAFIRLLLYHAKLLIIIPLIFIIFIIFLMKDEKRNYATSTTIYTGFASGQTVQNEKRDFFLIKTKFDNLFENIKSRTTREEIVLRTLAFYLTQESIPEKDMSTDLQQHFNQLIPVKLHEKLVVENNKELTYQNLYYYYKSSFDNEIYLILNSGYSPFASYFGLDKLFSLEATQEGTSDRVLMRYMTTDPGVTFHTARIALEVIMNDVKEIKAAESDDVVAYFIMESQKSKDKLDQAEKELSQLLTQNSIINYYEQTKWLASRKETFTMAFQEEKLKLAAVQSVEIEILSKMEIGKDLSQIIKEIDLIRSELKDASSLVAFTEIRFQNLYDSISGLKKIYWKEKIKSEKKDVSKIKKDLKLKVEELYFLKQSKSGINIEEIASKWLKAIIEIEEYSARIEQYIIFKKEFESTYSKFSKLGSKIKQIQRRITVLEKNYLNLLNSLTNAKLRRENNEMSTNLKIVDPPFYPVNAEKSNKLFYSVIGFLSGLVLTLTILLLLEFLDNTIKTPERIREITKLELVGGFPLLLRKEIPFYKKLYNRLVTQMATYINYNYYKSEKKEKPFIVLFFSTRKKEGKTQTSKLIARELRIIGEPTLVLSPKSLTQEKYLLSHDNEDNLDFNIPNNICDFDLNDIEELKAKNIENYRYVFIELPAIIGSDLPIQVMKKSHLSLLVVKANRNWNKADTMALDSYSKIVTHQISSILNGAHVDNLETIIGEIPKKRSWIRKRVKQLAKFQFKKNKF